MRVALLALLLAACAPPPSGPDAGPLDAGLDAGPPLPCSRARPCPAGLGCRLELGPCPAPSRTYQGWERGGTCQASGCDAGSCACTTDEDCRADEFCLHGLDRPTAACSALSLCPPDASCPAGCAVVPQPHACAACVCPACAPDGG